MVQSERWALGIITHEKLTITSDLHGLTPATTFTAELTIYQATFISIRTIDITYERIEGAVKSKVPIGQN